MKLFMATMSMGIGGAETHIVELCKELRRQGHDIAVCSNGGVYVQDLLDVGIRHYTVPMHRRHLNSMMASRRLLKQLIQQEQPDLVHAHARIPAFLCGSLQKQLGFPFVTTAHWVFSTQGLLRYMTNWGDWVVAVSEDIKTYLIEEYGMPPVRISTTINGIDTEKFSPQISPQSIYEEFGLDPSCPIVSYVSRISDDRALVAAQLIGLAPELDARFPGIQLLIAGNGNLLDQLTQEAEVQNQALGRRCVIMTGGRTDINQIVAAGDIFVGVSRAALEAMSGGKPVIVAGNEGYHGIFTQDKLEEAQLGNFCCRGLPLSTPQLLLEDITTLLNSSAEQLEELGNFGRQVIFQHYSVGRMAGDCLEMYRRATTQYRSVLMCGYYGFSNAGDDAILQAIYQELSQEEHGLEVNVLSKNPLQTQKNYGMTALSRFHLPSLFRGIKHCDLLLFGGGSLLQDCTSTRSLLYYLSVIWLAKRFHKPVMLYANGIGPVTKPRNRRLVRKAVEAATCVTLRDHSSRQELIDMGVTRSDLQVTADPVFQLPPAPRDRGLEILQQAGLAPDTQFVAVSVRSWQDAQGFPQALAQLCDHLHQNHGLTVLFVLMQPSHDRAMSQAVQSAMSAPSHILEGSFNPQELMAVLGEAHLCLAMRLHTLIFAARMGVPVLGLDYDPKVANYLEELSLPSAGRVSAFDGQVAIERADALLTDYETCRSELAVTSAKLTAAALENQRLLLQLLPPVT